MNEKKLLDKINSEYAAELFSELYGKQEIETARRRYTLLVNEFSQIEAGSSAENLRLFSAPGRTELGGNHTDHNRGKVLAASIQMDCVAVVQKRDDNTVLIRSAGYPDTKVKLTDSSGAPDLQPKPEEEGTTAALVRGIAFAMNGKTGGFTANIDSTVLPGSGLSSSAAVEVLICRIFDSLYGEGKLDSLKIAQIGQFAENNYFGKPCGLMDQTACASGGAVTIDFADTAVPKVKQINFDLAAAGYALCVVDTGGSHADLTPDYASVPAEMKAVAAFFGKTVLRELEKETVINNAAELRKTLGDRALLRAFHFFDENTRVDAMAYALAEMDSAATNTAKQQSLNAYLELVNQSGDSSWKLLQNMYSPNHPDAQGICTALALTNDFLCRQKLHGACNGKLFGACRVHGGGFAGTIQTYLPLDVMNAYRTYIEAIFGSGSVTMLKIRSKGAVELFGE